jgi:hypothetical protein
VETLYGTQRSNTNRSLFKSFLLISFVHNQDYSFALTNTNGKLCAPSQHPAAGSTMDERQGWVMKTLPLTQIQRWREASHGSIYLLYAKSVSIWPFRQRLLVEPILGERNVCSRPSRGHAKCAWNHPDFELVWFASSGARSWNSINNTIRHNINQPINQTILDSSKHHDDNDTSTVRVWIVKH